MPNVLNLWCVQNVKIQYEHFYISNPEWFRRDYWVWKQHCVYVGWNSVVSVWLKCCIKGHELLVTCYNPHHPQWHTHFSSQTWMQHFLHLSQRHAFVKMGVDFLFLFYNFFHDYVTFCLDFMWRQPLPCTISKYWGKMSENYSHLREPYLLQNL